MLHQDSKNVSLALSSQDAVSRGSQNNDPVALHLYRHPYDNLHIALSEFGHNPEVGFRINNEFGSLIASDDECICHGDFWPGNVLIQPGSVKGVDVQLTVVDWELVRRGTSATNVGQFAAEASLHDRFKGGRGLLVAFLECYVNGRHGSINKTWVKRMVVHWAVHVAYWPTRVQWTDREGTRQLVDMGVDVLKEVLDGDWGQLLELPLLRDVEDILRSLFV